MGWYIGWVGGSSSVVRDVREVGAVSARWIAELGERNCDRLATMLLDRVRRYLEAAAQHSPEQLVVWHEGSIITRSTVSCIAIGELIVHG